MYDRRQEGRVLELGVKGLRDGTLVMYDTETESEWSQLVGDAVGGPLEGRRLEVLPSALMTWGNWKRLHPESTVFVNPENSADNLFTGTGFRRMAESASGESAIQLQDLVIAVDGVRSSRAYPVRLLIRNRLVNDLLDQQEILVYLDEDLATFRVYSRRVGGRPRTFELVAGRLRDRESGSSWDPLSGKAIAGASAGEVLRSIPATYSLWYAWKKYRPQAVLYSSVEQAEP